MNKKFFSAVLMGALLLGGTFVSCQDYDDDIENLQNQIDKLASADLLNQKASELQSAISTAQSAASGAQSAADAAKSAAKTADDKAAAAQAAADALKANVDKAATKEEAAAAKTAADAAQAVADAAKAAAEAAATPEAVDAAIAEALKNYATAADLAALEAKVEALKTQIEGATTEDALAALEEKIDAIAAELESAGVKVSGITAVSLYVMNTKNSVFAFNYQSTKEHTATFSDDDENATIKFVEGELAQVNAVKSVILRVAPASAVLTAADVKLVNSLGEDLSELLEPTVAPYKELLTKADEASPAGLWKVTFNLAEGKTEKDLAKVVKTNDKNIAYAVAVNDVLTAFDVIINADEYKPLTGLDFTVTTKEVPEGVSVSLIKNRVSSADDEDAAEYVWKADKKGNKTAYVEDSIVWSGDDKNAIVGDDRSSKHYAVVARNPETKDIEFTVELAPSTYVRAWYVTYDYKFALDQGSEYTAWNAYTEKGLHTLYQDGETSATIKIGSSKDKKFVLADKEIIGFRVFAVNYDGTLVDPDGIAFYVQVSAGTAADEVIGHLSATINPQTGYALVAGADVKALGNLSKKYFGAAEVLTITDEEEEKVIYDASKASAITGIANVTKTVNFKQYDATNKAMKTGTGSDFDLAKNWTKETNPASMCVKPVGDMLDNLTYEYAIKVYNDAANNDYYGTIILNVVKDMSLISIEDSIGYKKFADEGDFYMAKKLTTGLARFADQMTGTTHHATDSIDLKNIFDMSHLKASGTYQDTIIVEGIKGSNANKDTIHIVPSDGILVAPDTLVSASKAIKVKFTKKLDVNSSNIVNNAVVTKNYIAEKTYSKKMLAWNNGGVSHEVLTTAEVVTGYKNVGTTSSPNWTEVKADKSQMELIWVAPAATSTSLKSGLHRIQTGANYVASPTAAQVEVYKVDTVPVNYAQETANFWWANHSLTTDPGNLSVERTAFMLDSIVFKSLVNATSVFEGTDVNYLVSRKVITKVELDKAAFEKTGLQEYFAVNVTDGGTATWLGAGKYKMVFVAKTDSPTPELGAGVTVNIPVKVTTAYCNGFTHKANTTYGDTFTVNVPVHFTAMY